MEKEILIIHGWGKGKKTWQKVKEILEENKIKVILPDLPGFGKNPRPKDVWGAKEYALWLDKLLKEKKNISLLAHSFGGAIALNLVQLSPEKFEKIILCSPAIFREKKKKARIFSFLTRAIKKIIKKPTPKIFQKIIAKILGNYDYYQAQGIMKEIFKKVVSEDFSFLLERISLPTLIIWGEKDKDVLPKQGERIKKMIENSQLVILKGVAHNPQTEKPERLSQIVIDFLKK